MRGPTQRHVRPKISGKPFVSGSDLKNSHVQAETGANTSWGRSVKVLAQIFPGCACGITVSALLVRAQAHCLMVYSSLSYLKLKLCSDYSLLPCTPSFNSFIGCRDETRVESLFLWNSCCILLEVCICWKSAVFGWDWCPQSIRAHEVEIPRCKLLQLPEPAGSRCGKCCEVVS